LLFTAIGCAAACADETVQIADSAAVLLRPSSPVASVILMPGGDGLINAGPNGQINRLIGNQLVRTRNAYLARDLAVLVANADIDLARAVQFMGEIKKPVTVIATSRGTIRTAEGIARGAKPNALVLTSGFLTAESGGVPNVASILGAPNALALTLVIHHRDDGCRFTQPAGVAPFVSWAQAARVPCGSAAGSQSATPARRVLITALMDSTRTSSLWRPDFTDSDLALLTAILSRPWLGFA
jgi:hypothetical protein